VGKNSVFAGVDAVSVAAGLVLVVIGALLGFACIPRDVDTDNLGCSHMWHEPPLTDSD
jgi:hypothetical protein